MTRDILSLVFAILSGTTMVAQGTVTINGRVISDHHESAFYDLMIVNKRTRSGTFGNADGTFSVKALQTDTLLLGAIGHMTVSITMTDSVPRDSYRIEVVLRPITVQLRSVEVLPERTLKEIHKEIASLGYNERDYRLSTVDALQSPITFLYQQFSRTERSKRLVAELQNEERKRALLKELLYKYVEYDIINLSDEAFDDFIYFCEVPDEIMVRSSQYDFLLYIKKKYELYTSLGPTRRH
ncbi:MAG: hypothetical protein KDB88_04725 [Flavobacteriales bacterium]|nr:hypothetical protein [Flavobacteriales bacterium]